MTYENVKNILKKGEEDFFQTKKELSKFPNDACCETFSTAILIPVNNLLTGDSLINTLMYSKPNYTGWPFWRDSRQNPNNDNHPKMVSEREWKCLEISDNLMGWPSDTYSINFWTIKSCGEFYQARQMPSDFYEGNGNNNLSPRVIAIRVAEVIGIGLSFARVLKCDENSYLDFIFKWDGINGKKIEIIPEIPGIVSDGACEKDSHESCITVFSMASENSIPSYVHEVTKSLFQLFGNYDIQGIVEEYAEKLIKRSLLRDYFKS